MVDRREIKILIDRGYSVREIADSMNRGKSAIGEEIKQGKTKGVYDPDKAHQKAINRRRNSKFQSMKIVTNKVLREFVENALMENQSVVNIVGRIKHHEKHLPTISKNIIYRFIESPYGRKIEHYRKKQPTKNKRRSKAKEKLQDRTFIDKRPKVINEKKRYGDCEADFILSGRSGRGILLTVIDRKSRLPFIEQIYPVSIENTHKAFLRIQQRFPELTSITTDNDLLFQHHKELARLLGIKIYFCHPYHSWEKGCVENLNKLIRFYIPKGSDISKYSQKYIRNIEQRLSNRYYKVLKYLTPLKVITKYRERKRHRSGA